MPHSAAARQAPPDYLTPAKVSERWGGRITVRTLNNWRTNGQGPPFTKIGGAVLYRADELDRWEKARTVHSTSQYKK